MKSMYTSLFAMLFMVAFSFANNTDSVTPDDCAPQTLDLGPGVVYPPNSLYAIAAFSGGDNIGRFSYFPDSDILNYDPTSNTTTGVSRGFGMDYNPSNGLAYVLVGASSGLDPRELYSIDLSTGTTTFVAAIVSSTGDSMPNAMTFDSNGTLYATFGGGELETIDLTTGVGSALGTVPGGGAAGITYDWDNDRLLYTFGAGPIEFHEIDPLTGVSNLLFTAPNVPGGPAGSCSAQAIEYLGGGKCIVSSTFGCGIIYTADINTGALTSLSDPNPFDNSIKDLMYINQSNPFTVSCNDASVEVQADLSIPYSALDISNAPFNSLYAIDAFAGGSTDVHLYTYDPLTDALSVNEPNAGMTGVNQFYGIDLNPVENEMYMLKDDGTFVRSLYYIDDIATGTTTFISNITSPLGDTQPQDMTFGGDGALYITFKSGEIALYDLATNTILPFADVGAAGGAGGVGLTYDFDNNRLLHASQNPNPVITAVDIATGAVSTLVTLTVAATAQGIEYVGGDKAIVSCTFGCDIIYSADLLTGVTTVLTNPSSDGFTTAVKDLMFINFDTVFSPATLDCNDIGANTIDVTVTDYAGNVSVCSATLTVTDPNDYCGLSVDEFTDSPFVMFPNPAGDSFQVQWNANEPLLGIEIFDILGKSVLTLDNIQAENPVIQVATLNAGVYVVKFQTELGTTTARLVKQ